VSQAFARLALKAGQAAAIVNLSSLAGITAVPNRAPYVTSKHAVVGLTRAMAIEFGTAGIHVNAITPGMIRTPMTAVMFEDPESERRIRERHALGREGFSGRGRGSDCRPRVRRRQLRDGRNPAGGRRCHCRPVVESAAGRNPPRA
jgi:NAD(P)-dependent dehydrogenase (short-subunit alcohol dehydrogenase family)